MDSLAILPGLLEALARDGSEQVVRDILRDHVTSIDDNVKSRIIAELAARSEGFDDEIVGLVTSLGISAQIDVVRTAPKLGPRVLTALAESSRVRTVRALCERPDLDDEVLTRLRDHRDRQVREAATAYQQTRATVHEPYEIAASALGDARERARLIGSDAMSSKLHQLIEAQVPLAAYMPAEHLSDEDIAHVTELLRTCTNLPGWQRDGVRQYLSRGRIVELEPVIVEAWGQWNVRNDLTEYVGRWLVEPRTPGGADERDAWRVYCDLCRDRDWLAEHRWSDAKTLDLALSEPVGRTYALSSALLEGDQLAGEVDAVMARIEQGDRRAGVELAVLCTNPNLDQATVDRLAVHVPDGYVSNLFGANISDEMCGKLLGRHDNLVESIVMLWKSCRYRRRSSAGVDRWFSLAAVAAYLEHGNGGLGRRGLFDRYANIAIEYHPSTAEQFVAAVKVDHEISGALAKAVVERINRDLANGETFSALLGKWRGGVAQLITASRKLTP